MKFKSFREGFDAGKHDAFNIKDLKKKEECPYYIDPEIQKLLKMRARWLEGYEQGWQKASDRKKKLKKKKTRRT